MFPLGFVISLLVLSYNIEASVINEVVFVVLSQEDEYHISQARQLKEDLLHQSSKQLDNVVVYLSHEDFPHHPGAWTILPVLPSILEIHQNDTRWIYFCYSQTNIKLGNLLRMLKQHNASKEIWLGHALHDKEATIIHHFAFLENPTNFKYPLLYTGFAMTVSLIKRLSLQIIKEKPNSSDFSIDASHELAKFIWDNGQGPTLQHSSLLCLRAELHCAAYPKPFEPCGPSVQRESIKFAVKSYHKFHGDRLPVIKDTWGQHATNIVFYSDLEDKSIPTIDLGIPNTETGHCEKTFAIIKIVAAEANKNPNLKWLFIADDDTILSVTRLQKLLTCFSWKTPISLGERYGYNVRFSSFGYNYITGGGGMVLNIPAVKLIAESSDCLCPNPSTPDDMFLGICLSRLGIPIIHSPMFHQARPQDYSDSYLKNQEPVSFHKHWMVDPRKVYEDWFLAADEINDTFSTEEPHVEL